MKGKVYSTIVNGNTYTTGSLKKYKKWLTVEAMIQHHKEHNDLYALVKKYKYRDIQYVKKVFLRYGYDLRTKKKVKANQYTVNKHPLLTKDDILWNKISTRPLTGEGWHLQ